MPPRLSFKPTDEHEFKPILAEIESSPVSPLGRTIFWLVIITVIFFAGWTILGQVDIVVSANGKVVPDGQAKIIQPLDTGIIANILVREGDYVRKGQPLIEIDPSSIQPEVEANGKSLAYAQLEGSRLKSTLYGTPFASVRKNTGESVSTQNDIYAASKNSLENQLRSKQEELEKIAQQMKGARVDQEENAKLLTVAREKKERLTAVLDIIARDEYDKVNNDILSYEDKVKQAQYKLTELEHQQAQTKEDIGHIVQEFKGTNLKELADRQKQITELEARLKESSFKNGKQILTAPVDGNVSELFVHTVGGVVTPAQKLVSIVPDRIPLLIQAQVLNRDIGFVSSGLPVQIKVDTFDFQKYGMFEGKVKLVSHDSKEDEDKKLGPIYDIYITPVTKYIMVDGKQQKLSPGMSVVAEIKVGKRHIIEFFIYPLIKYLHEGMSVR